MIFLIPRYKISSPNGTTGIFLETARLLAEGITPDRVFVAASPGFNLNCIPMSGIVLF